MQLTAFIKHVAYEFNKRNLFLSVTLGLLAYDLLPGWNEEQQPNCKTPLVCHTCF